MSARCIEGYISLEGFFYQSQKKEAHFTALLSKQLNNLKLVFLELPRYRRAPSWLDEGSLSHKYTTHEEFYRVQ